MTAAANTVPVDEAAAVAELETIAAGADVEAAAAADATAAAEHAAAGHDPAQWLKASEFAIAVLAGQGVPNWELTTDDCAQLSTSLAGVLDHYFPGGPNGPSSPIWAFAFAVGTVVMTRGVDWQRGALKPLRKPRTKDDEERERAAQLAEDEAYRATHGEAPERLAAVPGGDDSQRQEPKRFSMGGS